MIAALRRWAEKHAEQGRYSPVGIAFHWVMAALVIFQLAWGTWITFQPPGAEKLYGYEIHAATGLSILFLAIGRVIWRAMIPGPVNDADRLGWQTWFARTIHVVFYIAFFVLPLSGWAMWSAIAEPGPLHLAGILPWPRLPVDELPLLLRWQIMDVAKNIHLACVAILFVIIPLHAGAALKHHFWDRHDVLRGMLPEIPDAEDPKPDPKHKPRSPRPLLGKAAG